MDSEVCFECWRKPCKCDNPKTAEERKKEQEDRGAKAARRLFNAAKEKCRWGLDPKIDYEQITEEELGWVMESVLKQIAERCKTSDCPS